MHIPIHITVPLAIILSRVYLGDGSYNFERDAAQIIGVEPSKRWLVFMEAEVGKCTKMLSGSINGDMIALLGCLSYRRMGQRRCYCEKSLDTRLLSCTEYIIYPNSIHMTRYFWDDPYWSCIQRWEVDNRIYIYVHRLFSMNLSLAQFTATNGKHELTFQGKCPRLIPSLMIIYDGGMAPSVLWQKISLEYLQPFWYGDY